MPFSPNTNPSPPFLSPNPSPPFLSRRLSSYSTSSTPVGRVENLLATISSVLISYSTLPTASPIYISSLTLFQQRAASLSPNLPDPNSGMLPSSPGGPMASLQLPSQKSTQSRRQSPTSPATSSDTAFGLGKGPRSGLLSPVARQDRRLSLTDIQESPSLEAHDPYFKPHDPVAIIPPNDNDTTPGLNGLESAELPAESSFAAPLTPELALESEIDQLENDWWSSEVVAAWYGPRPPLPRSRSQSHSHLRSRSQVHTHSQSRSSSSSSISETYRSEYGNGRGCVFEAGYDTPGIGIRGIGRGRRRSAGSVSGGRRSCVTSRRNMFNPVAKNDASYVGLDDE